MKVAAPTETRTWPAIRRRAACIGAWPDQCAEHKCGEETDQRIQEIADSERVQECHALDRQFPSAPIG
jgi:hypothetical protein